ncbi:MAG: hypothetical protein U0T73_03410 [Chitinophagales bacterium]
MYIPINTPNVTLTLKGAVLRACGEKMWKGIEILPSGGRVITGADSLGHRTEIWDADIGIAMRTNSPIYHIDSTDFINNRVGMYMNGYKPLESSLKRSRFFTSVRL